MTTPAAEELTQPATDHDQSLPVPSNGISRPRPYERGIDPSSEMVTSFSALLSGRNSEWVTFSRVLDSRVLEYSYIYQDVLPNLGDRYTPGDKKTHRSPVWAVQSPFGLLEPISFAEIYVASNRRDAKPVWVRFLVLPGLPPPGGVSLMLGNHDVDAAYRDWRPGWAGQQDMFHGFGNGFKDMGVSHG